MQNKTPFCTDFSVLTKMIKETKMEDRRLSNPKKGFIVDKVVRI